MVEQKKSLGQNFLRDEKIVEDIVNSVELNNKDIVLEVGPGEGVLTWKLAKKCNKIVAIELDDRLIGYLNDKFSDQDNVKIVHEDILKVNLKELFTNFSFKVSKYKVIANLPYYITSPILRFFLESSFPPDEMVVMVQREVAERIVAKPGNMSILSVAIQFYARAEYLFTVPKESFDPVPKVESAVIKIVRRNPDEFLKHQDVDKKEFFKVVRAGFSARRKTLANNLANSLHKDRKTIERVLENVGLSEKVRAQEVSVDQWISISKKIK